MSYPLFSDEYFMNEALREASKAFEQDEVPVGAVVVTGNIIIARAHNLVMTLNDVTAHAEMQAITAAENYLGSRYLNDCTLYITLEPCLMCASASSWAKMGRIVYGADDPKAGFLKFGTGVLHPKTVIQKGVLSRECISVISIFFEEKRN